jgi:hypothetical protein
MSAHNAYQTVVGLVADGCSTEHQIKRRSGLRINVVRAMVASALTRGAIVKGPDGYRIPTAPTAQALRAWAYFNAACLAAQS